MSVEAPMYPTVEGGDDGSGSESDWRKWAASVDGTDEYLELGYVMEDVGRRMFAGRTAMGGFAEDFRSDRLMPKRASGVFLSNVHIDL